VTDHVPAGALAIARGRQVNKPGWAARKRRELAAEEKPRKGARRSKKARPRRAKKHRKR
jgi:hypothetical protein